MQHFHALIVFASWSVLQLESKYAAAQKDPNVVAEWMNLVEVHTLYATPTGQQDDQFARLLGQPWTYHRKTAGLSAMLEGILLP